ncbi:uncharacterized protein PV06_00112 [Exophiala oligosperma]|uniref:Uncharacterized protein n=1 Tax=Exophiala oligosperma TaxID=215243 RepID=A0A0D2B594_9EURO|nr:uncharacterized protein PV06_00112 [Exophiala oligosperma]KIW47416.1 hypothetical protein PV06_00112 [Exophiala oligosperma]
MVTYGLEARHTVVEAEASVHELKTPEESAAIWDEHRRKRAGRLSRCAAPNPSKRFPKPKVMGQKGPEKEETPKEQAVRHGTFAMDRFDTIVAASNDISYNAQIMSNTWESLYTGSMTIVSLFVEYHIPHILVVVADKDFSNLNIARYRGIIRFSAAAVAKISVVKYNGYKEHSDKLPGNERYLLRLEYKFDRICGGRIGTRARCNSPKTR